MLQAKKRFWGSKPGFDIGDILHIGVNVAFALTIYAMVSHWRLLPLAIILVLLSKWRVLAVQPRFWLPNIKANLVDIIVGISTIALIHQAPKELIALFWTGLYLGWLLFLKPQTQEFWVGFQAFWAQLLGLTAVFMVPILVETPTLVLAFVWIITWAGARHFFSNYEEPHYRTLGLIWALLCSQLIWMALHWIQYYTFFGVKIAIMPLVLAVIMGCLGSLYHSYKKSTLSSGVVLENTLFASALIAVMLLTAGWTPKL